MWTCQLRSDGGAFEALAQAFAERNVGLSMAWCPAHRGLAPESGLRVAFVQGGTGEGRLSRDPGNDAVPVEGACPSAGEVGPGDLCIVPSGHGLDFSQPLDLLVFRLGAVDAPQAPAFVRPDHDPLLTDSPGGCAEEDQAYRRLLLTWSAERGPYLCHALNAHRVRMWDSFSHYHPLEGGFEELYLVQHAAPGAELYWSPRVSDIERSDELSADEARGLVSRLPLVADQLVYLPRGTMHRAVGGALAQVITVPGFVPQREIGLDHHLRRLQERLDLQGPDALPFRAASSGGAVIQ